MTNFLLIAMVGLIALAFLVVIIRFVLMVRSMWCGAPYVATTSLALKKTLELIGPLQGKTAADLGSGDGRVVIALAKAGANAIGFETNPFLVWRSRRGIKRAGMENRAAILHKNYWRSSLGQFDFVYIYGISYIMPRLEQKLLAELKPGARVVSKGFCFPNLKPIQQGEKIFLYQKV